MTATGSIGHHIMVVKFSADTASIEDVDWSPDGLRRRLAALPNDDADAAGRGVLLELARFNRLPADRRHARTIEVYRSFVESLLPRLQARLEGIAPPIPRSACSHAHTIERLLKELAIAYVRLVNVLPTTWFGFGAKPLAHAPLVRAMDLLSRRLTLAYRLYARAPRGVWVSLHELFSLAQRWNLAARELSRPRTSPLAIYRKALLLAFADPARLPAGDVLRARDYIARFGEAAHIVRLSAAIVPAGTFVIDPRLDRPGIAAAKLAPAAGDERTLALHAVRLVDQLDQQVRQLEAGVSLDSLGLPPDGDATRYRALLTRLAANWAGARRNRAHRMRFRPRVELYLGFPGVWRMLEPPTAFGADDAASRASGGGINEWVVVNESPGGFALRHIHGVVAALRIGDIVGVRSRERNEVYVCLVRWIQSAGADQLDIGLQQLAPRFAPVTYRRTDGRSITHMPMLYAQSSPQHNRVPILVAPARLLAPGREFSVNYFGTEIALRADRVLESTLQADLVQVAPR